MAVVVNGKTAVDQVVVAHQRNLESVLNALLLVAAGFTFLLLPWLYYRQSNFVTFPQEILWALAILNGLQWFFALVRRIPYKVRAIFFVTTILGYIFIPLLFTGLGIITRTLFVYFIVMAFVLLGKRIGVAALLFACVTMATTGFLIANQYFIPRGGGNYVGQYLIFSIVFLIIVYLTYRLRNLTIGQAQELKKVSGQLEFEQQNLEEAVARRTHALSTASAISQKLLTIFQKDELLTMVVSSLSEAFNYYHVHIYMLDEDRATLRMAAGSGEVGMALFAIDHSIPLGKGLVGQAALMNISIFVPDVLQDKNWLPNPLLPETKSEIVVPITFGGKMIGVLDVQDDRVGGLMQEDVNVLETVALQLGVALRNAQIYGEAQQRAIRNMTMNKIVKQIRQAKDVETTLQAAVEGLGAYVGNGVVAGSVDMGQLANRRNGSILKGEKNE